MDDQETTLFDLSNGDISIWLEKDGPILLKCVTNEGDPVELNADEARELCAILEQLISRIDSD